MDELSRTKKKLKAESLQRLGEQLVALPEAELNTMEIPHDLKAAVMFAKSLTKHGARRRQMQYIGSVMRDIDPDSIIEAMDRITLGRAVAAGKFKEMEQWRDRLVKAGMGVTSPEDSNSPLETFLENYPGADRRRLSQLVRNAVKELRLKKGNKSSRALFRYIREIMEGDETEAPA